MNWKEYPQNIRVRLITSFFNRAVQSAVMPFMALFFASEIGKVWAGLFLVATVVVGFFINLAGGYISDRFQRKKVLLITSTLTALMFLTMTLSIIPQDRIIWLFALAYLGFTISSSLSRPSMHAIIIDSTTPENRKAVYAIDYWMVNLSMAVGTALGGLMYINHKIELFTLLTVVSACMPIAYWLWLHDVHTVRLVKQHKNVLVDVFNNYKIAFQDRPFVKVVVGSMFIFAAEFSMSNYIGVRLADTFDTLHIGDFAIDGVRMLSILNIENMLLVVCLTFLVNKITDRFNKQKVLLVGLLLYGIGYMALTAANAWYVLILFGLVSTLGELIYSPIRNAEQANMMPADKRGSYSAFSNLSFSGADMIARSTIVLGAFLAPSMMAVFIGVIVMCGSLLVYSGLFRRQDLEERRLKTKEHPAH